MSKPAAPVTDLTPRQREILQWLAHGKKQIEIADLMGLSITTIWTDVHRLMNKLGANTGAGAVAIGIRKGLVQ